MRETGHERNEPRLSLEQSEVGIVVDRPLGENPIGAIGNFLRVVREGGILYLAIPNRDYTFDRSRPATSLAHLWNDYEGRPEWTRERHFQEYSRGMSEVYHPGRSEADILEDAARLMAEDYSIHYHVWDMKSWIGFILSLHKRFGFRVECILRRVHPASSASCVECILRHSEEIITILAKTKAPSAAGSTENR